MTQAEILEEFQRLTQNDREPPADFMDAIQWKEVLQISQKATYAFLRKSNEAGILETDWKIILSINGNRTRKPVYRLKPSKKRGKK